MEYINSATNTLTSGAQSLGQGLDSAKGSLTEGMNAFSSVNMVNASSEFLAANSMIAKFVFIIFVLFLFMILFSLGSAFIAYLLSPPRNPRLVRGKRGGSRLKVIPQDPNVADSQIILRSNNEASGIEYTWETWLRIDQVSGKTQAAGSNHEYDHIFHKGNANEIQSALNTADIGLASVNNSPGLYVRRAENTLLFIQDVVSPTNGQQLPRKQLEVKNVPLNKWFHVALRLKNRVLDAYVNGQITARTIFKEVPKQNFDDVYICAFGGFKGEIADLRYFDRALTVFEINSIVSRGPNLAMSDDSEGDPGEYDYLSSLWYNNMWKNSA